MAPFCPYVKEQYMFLYSPYLVNVESTQLLPALEEINGGKKHLNLVLCSKTQSPNFCNIITKLGLQYLSILTIYFVSLRPFCCKFD